MNQPTDRMAALERIRVRIEQEYRDCIQLRARNERRLRELEEEMETVDKALDWARSRT